MKEALACGLYPICYDNSGPKDLIGRYGCGELVETGDIGALTAAIGMCVREVGACVARGLIAAQKVRSELSSEHVWNELLKVYDEVRK